MIKRTALAVTVLALAAAPGEGQTRFEVAMGPQFGVQDRETPISRGWIVSTGFEIDGQDYVVEGSWPAPSPSTSGTSAVTASGRRSGWSTTTAGS